MIFFEQETWTVSDNSERNEPKMDPMADVVGMIASLIGFGLFTLFVVWVFGS